MPAAPVVRCASHIPASQITQRLALIPRTGTSHFTTSHLALYPRPNAGCWYSSQRYTPTDWKVVNTLSYTVFNIYIMAHLLCAEEYWFIWVTVMERRSALKSTCTDLYWRLWTQATAFMSTSLWKTLSHLKHLLLAILIKSCQTSGFSKVGAIIKYNIMHFPVLIKTKMSSIFTGKKWRTRQSRAAIGRRNTPHHSYTSGSKRSSCLRT